MRSTRVVKNIEISQRMYNFLTYIISRYKFGTSVCACARVYVCMRVCVCAKISEIVSI